MGKDACYAKVKAQYAVFPSARASQAIAKCRKSHGTARKTTAGTSLKRWQREKWVNTKTGRACGNEKDRTEYCRPTKKVSRKTPKLRGVQGQAANIKRKAAGRRAKRV